MIKIAFATMNDNKLKEVKEILKGTHISIVSAKDLGIRSLPKEDGNTFLDNACIKAVYIAKESGLPTVGEDSGLVVSALGGLPGVRSARFAKEEHDYNANNKKLLEMMDGISDRRAYFICTLAFVYDKGLIIDRKEIDGVSYDVRHPIVPDGFSLLVVEARVYGEITDKPRGTNGFGFDPVFYKVELGKTFAELSSQEKDLVSHRGIAFRKFALAIGGIHG